MIIKTGSVSAGDGARITGYVVSRGDNEVVQVLKDNNAPLMVADQFAQLKGRKSGLTHTIISPGEELTPDELKQTLKAIRSEFGYNPADPETLSMHESKRGDGSIQKHYHLVRPAADSETGKSYKLFQSKCRDEAVCRFLELEFGHKLISGRHNSFAQKRLLELGRHDYADRVAEMVAVSWSSFNQNEHQQAKRNGFDLPKLRHQFQEIAKLEREQQPKKLAELIDREGLELRDAITEGRGRSRISLELPGDLKDYNCNRTLEICAADVAAFIEETRENLHDLRSNTDPYLAIERDPASGSTLGDHRGTGTDSPEQPRNDPSPKRTVEGAGGDNQELTSEAVELAFAAKFLKSETRQFAANRCSDLTAADLDAPPDINDPYILKKLAAMLKRQMAKTNAVVSLAFRNTAADM